MKDINNKKVDFNTIFEYKDEVLITDDASSMEIEGYVFNIDWGEVTISSNHGLIKIDGTDTGLKSKEDKVSFKGETFFGPCTIKLVSAESMCPNCYTRKQKGNFCGNCGNSLEEKK